MKRLVLSVSLILLLASNALAAMELKFQSAYPLNHITQQQFITQWSKSIGEKTNGEIVIHEFPGGSLVNILESSAALANGTLDLGGWGATTEPKLSPHWLAGELPFLANGGTKHTAEHSTRIFWAMYEQSLELQKEAERFGQLLFLWGNATNAFFSINNEILSPADIKGKRVLVLTPSHVEQIKVWGGTPVYIAAPDCYIGLQRGMGEILYTAIPYSVSLRIMEIAKYMTIVPSNSTPMMISINNYVWQDLTPDQQKVFLESSGKEASIEISKILDKDAMNGLQKYVDAKVQITELNPEQLAVFENGLRPLIETTWVSDLQKNNIKGDAAKAWIDKWFEVADTVPVPQD